MKGNMLHRNWSFATGHVVYKLNRPQALGKVIMPICSNGYSRVQGS